jgi:hypothetical protein
MQSDEKDDLLDYNEIEEYNKSSGQHAKVKTPSHSPTQTPPSLKSDEDSDEVDSDLEKDQDTKIDLEEGQEIEMDTTSSQQALVERKQKEFETLTERLQENGWGMRYKVFQDPFQSNLAIPMNASTRTLAEILQSVPLEDAEQISEFQETVYMPLHFLERYLLPSMQFRKLIEAEQLTSGEQPLPGGPETAILYSLYHQTKTTMSSTQDNKLRSLVMHSDDETSSLVKDITEIRKEKAISLQTYTNQLRDITRLPSMQTLCRMTPEDVEDRNELINSVLSNFEQQLKRDYKAYERERHQNVPIAKLNYEQQLHILDANTQYLELSSQRQEIVEKTAGLDVQVEVSRIKDNLQSLQEDMAKQCRDLTSVLGPLDTTHLMNTMKRLRDALKDATYQNAYLVMNNNELSLENSFMTPTQRETIKKIKAEQSHYYMLQREKPHYIEAYPEGNIISTVRGTAETLRYLCRYRRATKRSR